ncbi:MAG TPA: DNA (cytosine-5-)-methyltransferase [Candidatus Saccharimonadales bacterium]|nr:DNA (cytosine-5-)-methyltransferase [Candidatus Saccharimonadales bacterium]
MDGLLTVIDAANVIGVSVDTIRRWEKKGILKSTRSTNNYRLFNIDEVKRVHTKSFGQHTQNNYRILKNPVKSPYTSIELFAGTGGTALGLENAGLNHVFLNDYDKDSVATLKKNRPAWNSVLGDVTKIDFTSMRADVVQGGFPCQAFSYAGKGLGFAEIRGTMFFEFARAVEAIKPKIAVGENVKGLLKHDDGKTLATMVEKLEDLGYSVKYKVLRSQYLDVPQKRERLMIIGIRNDIHVPFLFPKEKDYTISLREAFENCPASPGQQYPEKKKKILDLVPPGGYWRDLPTEIQKEYMGASFYLGGGKTGMARRLSWDEPSLTLTCAPAQKQTERCHPDETRPLTVREYARLQTFPDKWEFQGSTASQYKQIGNAVPVNLGYHMGRCIIAMLDNKPDAETMDIVENEKKKQSK